MFCIRDLISIFKNLIKIIISGIAKLDRQNADDIGPTSLTLTRRGLTPRQAAPKIRVIAINDIGGFSKSVFKFLKCLINNLEFYILFKKKIVMNLIHLLIKFLICFYREV